MADLEKSSGEEDVRTIVLAGLSDAIPYVGSLVSSLLGIMWPTSGVDYWEEVREQVEALIDEKISADVLNRVESELEGLYSSMNLYLDRLGEAELDLSSVYVQCIATINAFSVSEPQFRQKGHEVLLLPLYAQMVNLYLSVVSDLVNHGKEWGVEEDEIDTWAKTLRDLIDTSVNHCLDWVEQGRADQGLKDYEDIDNVSDWKNYNEYMRGMTQSVTDYVYFWPYFDHENGSPPPQTREIFSDPTYVSDKTDDFILIDNESKDALIKIEAWLRSDGITYGMLVTYGSGEEEMLGAKEYEGQNLSKELDFSVSADNRIVEVEVHRTGSPFYFEFSFEDGSTEKCGVYSRFESDHFFFKFDGQVLASVQLLKLRDKGALDIICFGFRYPDSY